MRNLTQQTFDQQNQYTQVLNNKPIDLMQFAPYIENVENIEICQERMDQAKLTIEQSNTILKKYDVQMIKQIDIN